MCFTGFSDFVLFQPIIDIYIFIYLFIYFSLNSGRYKNTRNKKLNWSITVL